MTYGGSGFDSQNKNERREAAREKARVLRDAHRKRDRTRRALIPRGIVVFIVVVIAVIALVVANGIRPPSRGPLNMASDGIKIGTGFKAVTTTALKPGEAPIPSKTNSKDVIAIQIYLDYQCPICGSFEKTNASQISTWVKSGAATLEIHPISILDRVSLGTKYSTRSANAAGCVANFSPNSYFDFSALLFSHQPAENTDGLTDDQIISLVKKAKPQKLSSIENCVRAQTFKSWVNAATTRATTGPIVGTDVPKVEATPTVIINGMKYTGAVNDASAFASAVVKAAGDSFIQDSTATPTPTPTPTP
jgi:protein-disulfide isomerase